MRGDVPEFYIGSFFNKVNKIKNLAININQVEQKMLAIA